MKTLKKTLLIALPFIFMILLFTKIMPKKTIGNDPVNDYVQENNYPLGDFFTKEHKILTESGLAGILQKQVNASDAVEDIRIQIREDKTIDISAKLKKLSALFSKSKDFSAYSLWAAALDGKEVHAVLALEKETGGTQVVLRQIEAGGVKIDPGLLTPMFAKTKIGCCLNDIPYDSIKASAGQIEFTDKMPLLLQQF